MACVYDIYVLYLNIKIKQKLKLSIMKTYKEAWVNIYTTWKGGRSIAGCVLVILFEKDIITNFYRCYGHKQYSHGGTSLISHISERDIVKMI